VRITYDRHTDTLSLVLKEGAAVAESDEGEDGDILNQVLSSLHGNRVTPARAMQERFGGHPPGSQRFMTCHAPASKGRRNRRMPPGANASRLIIYNVLRPRFVQVPGRGLRSRTTLRKPPSPFSSSRSEVSITPCEPSRAMTSS